MNRFFLFIILLIFTLNLFSQDKKNDCYEYMTYPQNQNFCDTTVLTNGAKIYSQWNCDSTWLTFENKEKIILQSCIDLDPILCSRTGLQFIKEYPNYLFFVHNWISGCCTPPDLIFIDKVTGKEQQRVPNTLFISGDSDENYALYFSDTTYTELIYHNHELNMKYIYLFPKDKVLNSVTKNEALKLNDIFKEFKREQELFTFNFINEKGITEELNMKIK